MPLARFMSSVAPKSPAQTGPVGAVRQPPRPQRAQEEEREHGDRAHQPGEHDDRPRGHPTRKAEGEGRHARRQAGRDPQPGQQSCPTPALTGEARPTRSCSSQSHQDAVAAPPLIAIASPLPPELLQGNTDQVTSMTSTRSGGTPRCRRVATTSAIGLLSRYSTPSEESVAIVTFGPAGSCRPSDLGVGGSESRWLRYARSRCTKTTTTAITASAPMT